MRRHDVWLPTGMMFFFVAGSLGCVTQGAYNEVETQRDDFSARVQNLERSNLEFEEKLVELRARSLAIEEELGTGT